MIIMMIMIAGRTCMTGTSWSTWLKKRWEVELFRLHSIIVFILIWNNHYYLGAGEGGTEISQTSFPPPVHISILKYACVVFLKNGYEKFGISDKGACSRN